MKIKATKNISGNQPYYKLLFPCFQLNSFLLENNLRTTNNNYNYNQ